jgi:cytochrome oxidase Cu insertion factor (SCO1/SenC/PrrC family)
MQLSRVIDKIGSREVLQKFRRVTITYDPQFPDIVIDDPAPTKPLAKRRSKGSYGI